MQLPGWSPGSLMVMGGGIMEWRRDRDRYLHLHSGYCVDTSPDSRPEDLLTMAALLVKESLPFGYTVVPGEAPSR